jgi:hypothetical protein
MATRRANDDPDLRLERAEPPQQAVVEAQPFPGRHSPGKPHHDAVDPDLLDDLHLAIGKGLALVGVDEHAAPEEVVRRIGSYVDDVRGGRARAASDAGEAALALACLYGQAIGRELGWGWGHVRCVRKPGIFVISPDRRWVTGPRAIVDESLRAGGDRILAHFATLRDRKRLPAVAAGTYRKVP